MQIADLRRSLKEIQERYPETLDLLFATLEREWHERPLVADTTDRTLTNVYRRDGALEALRDAHERFIKA